MHYVQLYGVDLSSLPDKHHKRVSLGTRKNRTRMTDEEVFAENSGVSREYLRRRFAHKCPATSCSDCGLREWMGKDIEFQLDHKNGVNTDHRLENLRWLCPNCHSQTDTYCRGTGPNSRVDVPAHELLVMAKEKPLKTIGSELGVSQEAVRRKLILKGDWDNPNEATAA